jgi:hypothetical protein
MLIYVDDRGKLDVKPVFVVTIGTEELEIDESRVYEVGTVVAINPTDGTDVDSSVCSFVDE